MQKQFSALNFAALLMFFWAASVLGQQTQPSTPSSAPGTPAQTIPETVNPADTAMPQMAASSVAPDYRIGPGDTLQIFVWRNPELTQSVPVRPDGKISTPLVEDMVAVGKTPSQLARDVEKVLGEYIRSPQVNVIVTNPLSAFSQVKVIGQVTNPQSLPYREGMRVLDAILSAGGLTEFAAGNRGKIVRKVNGKDTELRVKVEDLVNKGEMKYNLELKPGDVVVVPQSFF
jgi:polysaccharide biosynthesis/export protein